LAVIASLSRGDEARSIDLNQRRIEVEVRKRSIHAMHRQMLLSTREEESGKKAEGRKHEAGGRSRQAHSNMLFKDTVANGWARPV
jgi:hypothetical protein